MHANPTVFCRAELTSEAKRRSIKVFEENAKALLSEAPLGPHVVLAIDPGYRKHKVVVVNEDGEKRLCIIDF